MNGILKFDEVGKWSEIKLEIIKQYACAYSKILASQPLLSHNYIDAFAGAGVHLKKSSKEPIPGSPLIALNIQPKFKKYYLIDLDQSRIENLSAMIGERNDVELFNEDCNEILINKVFPDIKYEEYKRALCILDPYGLNLKWEVVKKASETGTIEIFLNFPISAMNRNAIWTNRAKAENHNTKCMDRVWGDSSWREEVYEEDLDLFETQMIKLDNKRIAEAYRKRLQKIAGFRYVPEPIPMKNSRGSIVYYLFFAGHNKTGAKIASAIFRKFS